MNSPEGGPQAEYEFRPLSGTNILQNTPYINIDSQCTFQVLHIASATDRARKEPAFLAFLAVLELGCARHQVSVRMAEKVPGFRSAH